MKWRHREHHHHRLADTGRQRALLVTLVTWLEHVPLRDGRALTRQHAHPVVLLLRAGGLATEHDATNQVVLALRVIIPDADNQNTVIHQVGRDVEAERLIINRIYRVALDGALFRFNCLVSRAQANLHVGI